MRVHELAKELGVASKELLASLKEMGIDGLTASSSVPDQAVPRLRASGGKAVPEAKIKEAVEEPLPTSRPRKRKEVLEPETPPAADLVSQPSALSRCSTASREYSSSSMIRMRGLCFTIALIYLP